MNNETNIDVSSFQNGIYLIKIISETGNILMQVMMLHPILSDSLCEFKTSVQFDCIYAFVYFCFLFYNIGVAA